MPEKGALLAVLIIERPLCVDCIAEKSAIATDEIEPIGNDEFSAGKSSS